MDFFEYADGITEAYLRRTGATKWSAEDKSIGAFVAEMDFGVAPPVRSALHDAVDAGAFGYMPLRLVTQLRTATVDMLAERHGWNVLMADVHPFPDVIKALELAIKHHCAPDSKIIVPTPAYMPFLSMPRAMGREVLEVPMLEGETGYALDLEGIDLAFKQGGNLLLLCNPHNPTGRVFSRDDLLEVSTVVDRNKGRVFADRSGTPWFFQGKPTSPMHRAVPSRHSTAFQVMAYEPYVALCERLNALAPFKGPAKSILFSTGAECVENAIKIARAATHRPAVIAFAGGFHGRTALTMALTGKVIPYKQAFGISPPGIYHLPFPSEEPASIEHTLNAIRNRPDCR